MAFQSALSELRKRSSSKAIVSETATVPLPANTNVPKKSRGSLFVLDDNDLFSFDEDDIFKDVTDISFPPPSTSHHSTFPPPSPPPSTTSTCTPQAQSSLPNHHNTISTEAPCTTSVRAHSTIASLTSSTRTLSTNVGTSTPNPRANSSRANSSRADKLAVGQIQSEFDVGLSKGQKALVKNGSTSNGSDGGSVSLSTIEKLNTFKFTGSRKRADNMTTPLPAKRPPAPQPSKESDSDIISCSLDRQEVFETEEWDDMDEIFADSTVDLAQEVRSSGNATSCPTVHPVCSSIRTATSTSDLATPTSVFATPTITTTKSMFATPTSKFATPTSSKFAMPTSVLASKFATPTSRITTPTSRLASGIATQTSALTTPSRSSSAFRPPVRTHTPDVITTPTGFRTPQSRQPQSTSDVTTPTQSTATPVRRQVTNISSSQNWFNTIDTAVPDSDKATPIRRKSGSLGASSQQQSNTGEGFRSRSSTFSLPTPRRHPVSSFSTSTQSTPLRDSVASSTPRILLTSSNTASSLFTPVNVMPNSSSAISTPLNRPVSSSATPLLGSQPTPLICTPTLEPDGGQGVEVLRTPVAMAKRKFPGPAGLLPPLTPGMNMDNIHIATPSTPVPASTPRACNPLLKSPVSGASETTTGGSTDHTHPECECDFDGGPWIEMLQDLDLNDSYSSSLLNYSISNAIKQYCKKELSKGKIAHLRVMLKSIVPAGRNASAVLKDPTGEIMCSVHSQVLEENQRTLQPGAVLVLRQVSMFSPGPRKHYLNVTPPNVVRVYPPAVQTPDARQPLVQILSDVEKRFSDDTADTPASMPQATRLSPTTQPLFQSPVYGLPKPRRGQESTGPSAAERGLHALCRQQPPVPSSGARLVFGKRSSMGVSSSRDENESRSGGLVAPSTSSLGEACRDREASVSGHRGGGGLDVAAVLSDCDQQSSEAQFGSTEQGKGSCPNYFNFLCEDEFNELFADIAS